MAEYAICESRFTRGEVSRECPVCRTVFTARAPKHTYCCIECRCKATGRRIGRCGSRDVCPECGRSFVVRASRQVYCCEKCRNRARGRRYYWERGGRERMRERAMTPRGRMLSRMNARKRRQMQKLKGR